MSMVECNFFTTLQDEDVCVLKLPLMGDGMFRYASTIGLECDKENCIFQRILSMATPIEIRMREELERMDDSTPRQQPPTTTTETKTDKEQLEMAVKGVQGKVTKETWEEPDKCKHLIMRESDSTTMTTGEVYRCVNCGHMVVYEGEEEIK